MDLWLDLLFGNAVGLSSMLWQLFHLQSAE